MMGREERLLEPVRLALDAVDEHAADIFAIDAAGLEDVSRRVARALTG